MTEQERREEEARIARFERDLHPNQGAGVNHGRHESDTLHNARTAYDIKELHERLPDFTDDMLRLIPVLPQGSRLEQGAVYIDLQSADCREYIAMGSEEAGPRNWFVPKAEVDYQTWNRLIGVRNPERLGEADDS